MIGNHSVWMHATATAGVVIADHVGAGHPTARLLQRANTALQHGKRTGRGTAILWRPELPALPRPRGDGRPGTPPAGDR